MHHRKLHRVKSNNLLISPVFLLSLLAVLFIVASIIVIVYANHSEEELPEDIVIEEIITEEPQETVAIVTEDSPEVPDVIETEVSVGVPVPEEVEPQYILYDIPLEDDFQLYVTDVCNEAGIDPRIIFCMMYKESRYDPTAVGDHGDSLGLLQVQPKWNAERMERLGVTDLHDPHQNVLIAVDIFKEFYEDYDYDVEKAIIVYGNGPTGAYNNFFSKGLYSSNYSRDVLEMMESLPVKSQN